MKAFIKSYWKTLLFFTAVGLFGGYFVGLYLLDSYPAEIRIQLMEELNAVGLGQLPLDIVLGVTTAFQSAGYGLVLGAIGIFLAKRIGLWQDERKITKKPLLITLLVAVMGGLGMILPDVLFFGRYSTAIMESYSAKPTIPYLLATVSYGAVIEEVMLRLFFMSLLAFLLHKLLCKEQKQPPTWILITANLLSALLFAASHLPTTILLLGNSPLLIFRCFLLNGSLGLLFGWLYRRLGLRYAMIAHGGCHLVSKLIWILFI